MQLCYGGLYEKLKEGRNEGRREYGDWGTADNKTELKERQC